MSGIIAMSIGVSSILSSVQSCVCNMYDSGTKVRYDSETYWLSFEQLEADSSIALE